MSVTSKKGMLCVVEEKRARKLPEEIAGEITIAVPYFSLDKAEYFFF